MTEAQMAPAKATALRKPFPKESIGHLPKGGVMLEYVGHAAVTDRLLSVDPNWSWEPFAIGPDGLPAIDHRGNLWIRLTICGVTRIGVGDGKSPKECIGDAIRNAAMRFGVALDLWAKENLVEFAQAATRMTQPESEPQPFDERVAEDREAAGAPPLEFDKGGHVIDRTADPITPLTPKTRARMFALFAKVGITDKDEQKRGIAHIIGHPIESRSELTEPEAKAVIKKLEEREKSGAKA